MPSCFDLIKSDLPNFPDEVVSSWLAPLAEDIGWPPESSARWPLILGAKPLSYWQGINWRRQEIELTPQVLDLLSVERINGMMNCYVGGIPNEYSRLTDGKDRVRSILAYIGKTGYLPVIPVFTQGKLGMDILDGNHRILSFFIYGQCIDDKEDAQYVYEKFGAPQELSFLLDGSGTTLSIRQLIWVGS